jgi:predicted dehydrogenase
MPTVAVVGTGFGSRVHVPALRAAGFDVLAVVGRDEERTARRAKRLDVPMALTSVADALARPELDAVSVATPPAAHAPITVRACRAGKHVLCEKPFALDAGEAVAMLDAAHAAGVVHMVGHEFRWAPERAVMVRAIATGLIGEPRTFSLVSYVPFVADTATRLPDWWFDTAQGGGWLGASGSHLVDQLRTWLGEVASVSAALSAVSARAGGIDDSFVVRARMRNGAEGVLQQCAASWIPAVTSLAIVGGTHGTLEADAHTVWCSDRGGRRTLEVPSELAREPMPSEGDDPRERYTHLELAPYTRLCEAFRAAIEGCAPPTSSVVPPTFADGVAEMQILDAIRASAAQRGVLVAVDYQGAP